MTALKRRNDISLEGSEMIRGVLQFFDPVLLIREKPFQVPTELLKLRGEYFFGVFPLRAWE